MRNVSRRTLLTVAAFAPLAACGVVTTTTTNGVTTITLDVAKLSSWASAINNAAGMVLPLFPATAPAVLVVEGIAAIVTADVAALAKATNGQVSLTFDKSSIPAAVRSVLTDGQTLLADLRSSVPQVPASVLTAAQTVIAALATVLSVLAAALGIAGAAPAAMTEGQALAVLGAR